MKHVIIIDQLEDGFVLTINGKTKAVETVKRVREIISEITQESTEKVNSPAVRRSILTIEFELNPPTIV